MTKKIVWRLKEQPSSESLRELVNSGLLTKDEAREILFSQQEETERDSESLKAEIKFLRELVEKLSNRTQIVEVIREVQVPVYRTYPWYRPYESWCSSGSVSFTTATSGTVLNATNQSFSDIKTF